MIRPHSRRLFLQSSAAAAAGLVLAPGLSSGLFAAEDKEPLFKISLAEYSLHRAIAAGDVDPLDFAPLAMREFGIDAVEHWNRPFFNKATDKDYTADMRKRADDAGVRSLLIMIDGEGRLGDPDEKERQKAVENHYKWIEMAKALGCHSIRVNASSAGEYEEQLKLAADGLRRLCEFAAQHELNVIVENHGGLSSNGEWLAAVMKAVGLPNCGTLPDFGNFHDFDRYKGVELLMPFAKGVSAKSHDFDNAGNETRTDYPRIMKLVLDSGYRGYVGIEYEGGKLGEMEGIRATQKLLERVRKEFSAA